MKGLDSKNWCLNTGSICGPLGRGPNCVLKEPFYNYFCGLFDGRTLSDNRKGLLTTASNKEQGKIVRSTNEKLHFTDFLSLAISNKVPCQHQSRDFTEFFYYFCPTSMSDLY